MLNTKLTILQNIKKTVSDSNLNEEAKIRREQLQEVLAKQAELGVEVAEVLSHYLSNPDQQFNGDRRDNNGGKKGRFQKNRNNKRRHGDKDKFNKKPMFQNQESMRKLLLLEKLLSADIKRDKSQLLQVFRFMVMNSFFQEESEKPLKLPVVMVEETSCERARDDHITEALCNDHDDDDDVDVNDEDVD